MSTTRPAPRPLHDGVQARHRVLLAVLAIIVAVVGLAAPTAPAGAATGTQNGVAAINPEPGPAVADRATVSPGSVGDSGPVFDDGAVVSLVTPRTAPGDLVGPHGAMSRPRPTGMESHHGVNSVWAKANVPGYQASKAPAVLMDKASHDATRGVFNRWRSEIAARQGVSVRDINWREVSPGSIWRLAEDQFAAARTAASTIDDYFVQWNRYIDNLRGGP